MSTVAQGNQGWRIVLLPKGWLTSVAVNASLDEQDARCAAAVGLVDGGHDCISCGFAFPCLAPPNAGPLWRRVS